MSDNNQVESKVDYMLIDKKNEMIRCFSNIIEWFGPKVKDITSLDPIVEDRLKQMYGIDIAIYHYDQKQTITYQLKKSEMIDNKIHTYTLKTDVIWWTNTNGSYRPILIGYHDFDYNKGEEHA